MTQFTTDIMQALVKKEDISEVFRKHLETAVNTLLQTELTVFLDYEKYDRIGEFNQQTVAPHKRSNDTLESFVIHMFQKGVTMFEISDLIEKMYGHHYTPQTISNMMKAMSEQFGAFKSRPFGKKSYWI